MNPNDFLIAGPILLPAIAALCLIAIELFPGSEDSDGSFWLALLGSFLSCGLAVTNLTSSLVSSLASDDSLRTTVGFAFSSTLEVDRGTLIAMALVHGAAFLAILLSRLYLRYRPEVEKMEYHALILVSACGMAMLAAANDLLNVFLAIELLSIPLYLLATIRRNQNVSIEAGLKYLLLGAFASAFLLFGMALLYAASGTTLVSAIPSEIQRLGTTGGLAAFGSSMFLVGILFKVAAVPFHMWTPDVYQGSPTPITAFMATATKVAMLALLIRFAPTLAVSFHGDRAVELLSGIAVITMFAGNLGALRQTNLKRLLAYSSISHGGYLLVGLAAVVALEGRPGQSSGASAIFYYLAAYTAMNIGAFAVAVVIDRGEGREGVSELAGFGRERPVMATLMTIFVLALAGIPPTAGFLGKLYLFRAAVDAELYGLAVMGVLASVVGLYYYLRLLMFIWVDPVEKGATKVPRGDFFITVASTVALGIVTLLGIVPGPFVAYIERALG